MTTPSSPEDNRSDSRKPEKPEDNPFIAFRQYADQQIASLLHDVMGLLPPPHSAARPQNPEARVTSLREPQEAEVKRDGDETKDEAQSRPCVRAWQRKWSWPPQPHDSNSSEEDGKWHPVDPREWEETRSEWNRLKSAVHETFFPAGDAEGESHGFPFAGFPPRAWMHDVGFPSFREMGKIRDWCRHNPYSPANLEYDPDLRRADHPDWQTAFWELQQHVETEQRPGRGGWGWDASWMPGSGGFWRGVIRGEWDDMPSWQERLGRETQARRGALNSSEYRYPGVREQDYHTAAGNPQDNSEPQTELDMYERFLGSASSPAATNASPPAAQPERSTPVDPSASPILSTLTTTERNVAADGTVTTRVVFKKRFADGREESSESTHTMQGGQSRDNWTQTPAQNSHSDGQRSEGGCEEKKSGWFWSG